MWTDKITVNEEILAGKPIVKGTRLSVDFIIDLLANDWSNEDILKNYPQLTKQDIRACLEYAASIIKDENVLIM